MLTTDDISNAIRGIVGEREDAFQDVWVQILEGNLKELTDIKQVARNIKKRSIYQFIQDRDTTVSMEKIISNKEDMDTITLEDTLGTNDSSIDDLLNDHEPIIPIIRVFKPYNHTRGKVARIFVNCPICGVPMGSLSSWELRASLYHYCSRRCAGIASHIKPMPKVNTASTQEDGDSHNIKKIANNPITRGEFHAILIKASQQSDGYLNLARISNYEVDNSKVYTLEDFHNEFPDNETCLEWIKHIQYPQGIICPICSKITGYSKVVGRSCFQCPSCSYQISLLEHTIFHKSSTPIIVWFQVIYLMLSSRCNISAKKIQHEVGVTYKTAWRMFKLIRNLMSSDMVCRFTKS